MKEDIPFVQPQHDSNKLLFPQLNQYKDLYGYSAKVCNGLHYGSASIVQLYHSESVALWWSSTLHMCRTKNLSKSAHQYERVNTVGLCQPVIFNWEIAIIPTNNVTLIIISVI